MPFDSWQRPFQIIVVGLLAYLALITILRLSGKRTLTKLSAFDFVVTVALGSALATVLLSPSTSLIDGLSGLFLLVALQFIISWISVRSTAFRRWVQSEPVLLFRAGHFLDAPMRSERIGPGDILCAVRKAGIADLSHVLAVVLEADGSLSVIKAGHPTSQATGALADVRGASAAEIDQI